MPNKTPFTGQPCGCRKGIERDNCPQCEGTGQRIDFAAVHYNAGYGTGHADKLLGQSLITARYSNSPNYARGYRDAQRDRASELLRGGLMQSLYYPDPSDEPAVSPEWREPVQLGDTVTFDGPYCRLWGLVQGIDVDYDEVELLTERGDLVYRASHQLELEDRE